MDRYDPDIAPDPAQWLALDEQARMDLVSAYHEAAGIELPTIAAHVAIHVAVETQVAGEFAPAGVALQRLQRQGLTRHDAVHAVGSALAEHLYKLMHAASDEDPAVSNKRYGVALSRLDVRKWLKRHGKRN